VGHSSDHHNVSNFDKQHAKGVCFEKFVVRLFQPSVFTLLEWRGDKNVDGIAPLSCKNPDLVLCHEMNDSKTFLAVECKYRSNLRDGFILEGPQYDNYEAFLKKTHIPVNLVVGIGGLAEKPYEVFVIPLKDVTPDLAMSPHQLLYYRRSISDQPFCWHPFTRLLQ